MNELKEKIGRKCRKSSKLVEDDDAHVEQENSQSEDNPERVSEIIDDFVDILAEKRREYTPKDEFVFLLYNDMLKNFICSWQGYYLRQAFPPKKEEGEYEEYDEEGKEEGKGEGDTRESQNEKEQDSKRIKVAPPYKIIVRDEMVDVPFINKNEYTGRVSRKMMEGKGIYRWNDGVQYKGEFEENAIMGKGHLEWKDNCIYEGDFMNGYRHGRGSIMDNDYKYLYIGHWNMGQKHGKGYCQYADRNTYEGDWFMGKRDGIGLRIYPTRSRYIGQWKNNHRHGIGTMVWNNGDVYRGEWEYGLMQGHGEYTWNGFFNKTLCWPREANYVGEWRRGMRHGRGVLKLNSIGGAKYSGYWKRNKKHGFGMIIGNNGEITEGHPLFKKGILMSVSKQESKSTVVSTEGSETTTLLPSASEMSAQPVPPRPVPLLKPEQFPAISYYINRLVERQRRESVIPLPEGLCFRCKSDELCSCLITSGTESKESKTDGEDGISSLMGSQAMQTVPSSVTIYEEKWMYNCITLHLPKLRQVYCTYAKIFSKQPPNCNLVMSRLSLWQMWRDCGVHLKGLSLIQLDNYLVKNKCTLVEDPLYPFEQIDIWQFLHALLELSWHLYSQYGSSDAFQGRLAAGFHKLLHTDIYPNVGNHIGSLINGGIDILSILPLYQLYQKVGTPPSAKSFLRVVYMEGAYKSKPLQDQGHCILNRESSWSGINCVTVGERVSFLPKQEESLLKSRTVMPISKLDSGYDESYDMRVFQPLKPSVLIDVMNSVYPFIKDAHSQKIINMDWEMTFLEFYEVLYKSSEKLLEQQKIPVQRPQSVGVFTLQNDNLLLDKDSETGVHSGPRRSIKLKK